MRFVPSHILDQEHDTLEGDVHTVGTVVELICKFAKGLVQYEGLQQEPRILQIPGDEGLSPACKMDSARLVWAA